LLKQQPLHRRRRFKLGRQNVEALGNPLLVGAPAQRIAGRTLGPAIVAQVLRACCALLLFRGCVHARTRGPKRRAKVTENVDRRRNRGAVSTSALGQQQTLTPSAFSAR
jgi:hypothetical protein